MSDLFSRFFDELSPGERFATRARTVTEADVCAFAGLTGDRHPLHTDAVWAASSTFGQRIAHGFFVASAAAGLIPFDPDRVLALRRVRDVTFKKPVHLGDTIRVEGVIAQVARLTDEAGLVVCDWRVKKQDDSMACRITADVLWRRTPAAVEVEELPLETGLPEFIPIPL